ncbi:MAG: hypothetical protein JKX68_10055 [Flavobacteriales bacterium]|nr:hypothetical protein [Flavobacteriales bacterium]
MVLIILLYLRYIKHLFYIILFLFAVDGVAQFSEEQQPQIDSLNAIIDNPNSTNTSIAGAYTALLELFLSSPIEAPFVHQVIFNYEYDISGLNDTLYENHFTVDVVLFLSDHIDVTWAELQQEFLTADSAFRAAGVQLNLKKAVNVSFPAEWNNQAAEEITALPDSGQVPEFYDKFAIVQAKLTTQMEAIFNDFVADEENKDRTIFILPLSGMKLVFSEQNPDGTWKVSDPYPTGAMSYPAYVLHNRIPRNVRGVITQQQSRASRRTLAHEMGHKLINVSHEGLDQSSAFEGFTTPGLMGYGTSLEIYRGEAGRWHQERLLKSPFLYKMVNGEQIWNQDYIETGGYDDPIYKGLIMPD